ncbi:MAG: GNAT family N-acetyltransferase [Paracoccus sp. (in: a-proteobacteria)]|nr:GNAT family N-acetyltransferase [Paracoccus sp. (in: a-proteobacteria)]
MKIARTTDLAACHALRRRVFIEEQAVPEADESDGLDADALHYLATGNGAALGCARVLIDGSTAKIGRVCIAPEARGTGAGAALMRSVMDDLRGRGDLARLKLSAQVQVIGFYERLGFVAYGPEYLDAGISHRDMALEL